VGKCFGPGVVLVGLAMLVGLPWGSAGEKKKPAEVKPDLAAEQMRYLASALDVAALGAEQRDPLLSLAAARALRSIHVVPGPVPSQAGTGLEEPPPLLVESNRILRGSRRMPAFQGDIATLAGRLSAADDRTPAVETVRHIAAAYDLASIGRQEKAPEMLVAAARILRGFHAETGKGKATIEHGKDEKPTAAPPSLKDASDKLLDEAEQMAAVDPRSAGFSGWSPPPEHRAESPDDQGAGRHRHGRGVQSGRRPARRGRGRRQGQGRGPAVERPVTARLTPRCSASGRRRSGTGRSRRAPAGRRTSPATPRTAPTRPPGRSTGTPAGCARRGSRAR
jgi:hypothetical protein